MKYITGMDTADVLKQIKAVPSLKYTPGEGFSYGNFVTVLRALIIEKVSGIDFKSYVEETLFKPSKMSKAFARDDIQHRTSSMAFGEKPLAIDGVTAYMTARDLYNWEKARWNSSLINRESFMSAVTTPSKGGRGRAYFDFGFYRTDQEGRVTQLWHDGTYPKHFTLKYHDLERDLFIILLSSDGRKATLSELRQLLSSAYVNSQTKTETSQALLIPASWNLNQQLKSKPYTEVFAAFKVQLNTGELYSNESELTSMAYSLRRTNVPAALELMALTVEYFPSANAHDSFVDLLLQFDKYQRAKSVAEKGLILARQEKNAFVEGRLVQFIDTINKNLVP
jgi:hypothetical protein